MNENSNLINYMSDNPTWISTDDIIKNPQNFYDKEIILRQKYSLVNNGSLLQSHHLDDSKFNGIIVHGYIRKQNCIHVLIEIDSLEDFQSIRTRFVVEGMNMPENIDNILPLDYYNITAILSDGSRHSFSQGTRAEK